MAKETIAYNKNDLRDLYKAFKLMDETATDEARRQSAALAYFASEEIKAASRTRTKAGAVAQRVADGVSISKSSKIGEFSYGFARQKFSGGATTQTLWGGIEFGSKDSLSSLLFQEGNLEEDLVDGLFIRPFAKFSLN
jgi:hypothetical protein